MSPNWIRIDGREFEPEADETLLELARRAGIDVPTLCKGDGLEPDGGCRLCLVEVEGRSRPVGSCHTRAEAGMVVRTESDGLRSLRRGILQLYLDADPRRAAAGPGRFRDLLARYGLASGELEETARELEASHPYLRFDRGLCITCRRCLHACEEIQGQFVFGVGGRGAEVELLIGPSDRFADSDCTACGACLDQCPTGALFDVDASREETGIRVTESVCGYCGVGCRIRVEEVGGRIARIEPVEDAAVNRGHLCAKGRYAHGWQSSPDRLTEPLLRRGGGLEPVSWGEALSHLANRLEEIRSTYGADALGAFSSSRSTNEAAYLLQKLFRSVIGTNNVDCCARVCHSSTALALRTVTGTGAASASYADIERASCIVVAGANPTEAHPVIGARIKQAVLRGARLIVVDPRRIELTRYADLHLGLLPGTNVSLFNGLARVLIHEGWIHAAYLDERVEGLDELTAFVGELSMDEVVRVTGVAAEDIHAAAELMSRGPVLFVHGLGLSELFQGTASVMTLANLGMLTGSIGRPGAGMLPLRGQNNVQGNADMGAMPNLLTGYQALDDPEVRDRIEAAWGGLPPTTPGLTIPEMIDAATRREIRGLWIMGEDVVQSDPNERHVIEALQSLDFLVVQELFLSETAQYADLVLPAAGYLEQEGTFTNGERRIQHVRPAISAPGEARPDWEVVRDTAVELGATWQLSTPAHVMEEVARVAPRLFGGVRYSRLEPDGLQWPCPDLDHPGTANLHAEGFLRGKGSLVSIDYAASDEHGVEGYPYLLVTGRVLQQYNVGTMTRRTPHQLLAPRDLLEIHPDDAGREKLQDGEDVTLESRWGRTRVRVVHSSRVAPGTLFLSFHHPETHANRLTGPVRDPDSNCPQYKATAVRFPATA